jgi:hypothetical protein
MFNPMKPHLNPRFNYRDHRKICVIDGNVGFTGGLNLADEYINRTIRHGHWKDTAVMLRGDAVWNLSQMFLYLWMFSANEYLDMLRFLPTVQCRTDGFVQPFGDSPLDDQNVAENAYIQIINCARRYVWITTPYLILDNEMITALRIAARAGSMCASLRRSMRTRCMCIRSLVRTTRCCWRLVCGFSSIRRGSSMRRCSSATMWFRSWDDEHGLSFVLSAFRVRGGVLWFVGGASGAR